MATSPRQSARKRPAASSEALVRRAADGDQVAWHGVVERYSGLLDTVTRRSGLPEAQSAEVVQTTWLRLLEDRGVMREPERLAGWLRATARRECRAALRGTTGEQAPVPDEPADDPEVRVLREERAAQVRAAVRHLPEHSRRLVGLLVATPPLSDEEIGARLDVPADSVGPARARVISVLRTTLADADLRDVA